MLNIEALKDGYVSLHTKTGGQVFLAKKGDKFYSVNLDGVDPNGFQEEVIVDPDGYHLAEAISQERFHAMREQANTRYHINKLTGALQLAQLVEQGKVAGIIEATGESNPPAPPAPPRPTLPKPPEAPKATRVVSTPGPAPIAPKNSDDNPGAPLSSEANDDGLDGVVVEVPPPGQ